MAREAETYARITDGVVREIIRLPAGSPPPAAMFHPLLVKDMRRLSGLDTERVQPGWLLREDGSLQAPPAPPVPPESVGYVPAALARERLEADGYWDEVAAILAANPSAMLKVVTLREGIDPADAEVRALLTAAGADPDRILAPPGTVLPPLPPAEP